MNSDLKTLLGITAIALTLIGYIPYFHSILQKKTKPHLYSWFIYMLDAFIIFALQITHGAGIGSTSVLAVAIMCLIVIVLTLRNKEKLDITNVDKIFSCLALLALILWLFVQQPLLSSILIVIVDLMGFVPTIRKSWRKPYSETPVFYAINILRFSLTLASIQQYSIITTLYPSVWLLGNTLFTLMLITRRKFINIRSTRV